MENDTTQLSLIEPAPGAWRLDERTREAGRKGVAEARRAIEAALAAAAGQTAA